MKYLGLIIEKDCETDSEEEEDSVPRKYIPIREKYIELVKLSRNLTLESLERRGASDFRRTKRTLSKIGQYLKTINYQNWIFKYYIVTL